MNEKQDNLDNGDEQYVACDICMKQVPISEAQIEEVSDYVMHFCGLKCYNKWRKQAGGEQQ